MAVVTDLPESKAPKAHTDCAAPHRLVVFALAEQLYAIDVESVQEILPLMEFSCPPTCPTVLAGFIALGTELVPVVNLSRVFDVPEPTLGLYTPLIVLRRPRFALLVDKVTRIVNLPSDLISPLRESHSVNDCVSAVISGQDAPILVLNPDRLLLKEETQCLAELASREQSRLEQVKGVTQ